jgi:hypothetical protein
MNRQEIIEQLKLIQAGLTQDDNNKSKNRIDAVIENLKQPITLADFLGWEENAIYTDGNIYYKVKDGMIYFKIKKVWNLSGYNNNFNACYKLREYEKVGKIQPKYNLILQKGYRKLFDLQDNEKYLTIDTTDGTVFNSKYSNNNSKYQAQFKLEEIEEIKRKHNIDLCIYDIVEV